MQLRHAGEHGHQIPAAARGAADGLAGKQVPPGVFRPSGATALDGQPQMFSEVLFGGVH
jgi:hypothetical protein